MKTIIKILTTAALLLSLTGSTIHAVEVSSTTQQPQSIQMNKAQQIKLKIEQLELRIQQIPKKHKLLEEEFKAISVVNDEIKDAIDKHLLITQNISGTDNPDLKAVFLDYMDTDPGNTLMVLKHKVEGLIAKVENKLAQAQFNINDIDSFNHVLQAYRAQLKIIQQGASL